MAFDLPIQMGNDFKATVAQGEVGKSGIAIVTLRNVFGEHDRGAAV